MMHSLRILLLSNTRPSRAWRVANRLENEVASAEICGVIQQPLRRLPLVERLIAARQPYSNATSSSRLRSWFRLTLEKIMHLVLWFVHGCPLRLNRDTSIGTMSLAAQCGQVGWSFLLSDPLHWRAREFMRRQRRHVVVILGQTPANLSSMSAPAFDLIRFVGPEHTGALKNQAVCIGIEYLAKGAQAAVNICSLSLLLQPLD